MALRSFKSECISAFVLIAPPGPWNREIPSSLLLPFVRVLLSLSTALHISSKIHTTQLRMSMFKTPKLSRP